MADRYDLVVIGAGPGGYVGAIKAAQLGLRTAIVEARQVGGTCLNRGCIPTKTLMHSSHLYHEMQNAALFGLSAEGINYDIVGMHARKDEVVDKMRSGVEFLLKANKVDMVAFERPSLYLKPIEPFLSVVVYPIPIENGSNFYIPLPRNTKEKLFPRFTEAGFRPHPLREFQYLVSSAHRYTLSRPNRNASSFLGRIMGGNLTFGPFRA